MDPRDDPWAATSFRLEVLPDAATAPFSAAILWFVYQWVAWKCGVPRDRYSDELVDQPVLTGIVATMLCIYYGWTVNRRWRTEDRLFNPDSIPKQQSVRPPN
jgi:hypothetical protein